MRTDLKFKISQNDHCATLFVTVLAHTATDAGDSTRHRAGDPHPSHTPFLSRARASSISPPLFSFLALMPSQTEQSSSPGLAPAVARRAASFRWAPSCAASPRTCSAPPRARLSRLAAESSPPSPAAIANLAGAPLLSSISLLQPASAQTEPSVSISARPSSFLFFPTRDSAAAGAAAPPRRRLCRHWPP